MQCGSEKSNSETAGEKTRAEQSRAEQDGTEQNKRRAGGVQCAALYSTADGQQATMGAFHLVWGGVSPISVQSAAPWVGRMDG